MPKSLLNTTLEFGLVTAPIRLMPLKSSTDKISFNLASPDGNRVKQQYIDEATGEIIGAITECQRGIFDANGFHPVTAEALATIDEETKLEGLSITHFIDVENIPWERVAGAYYLSPDGKAGAGSAKSLAILRAALTQAGRAGIGELTIRSKTAPFVVYARDGAIVVNTLHYADAFTNYKDATETLDGVEAPEKSVQLAVSLIESLAGTRDDLDSLADNRTDLRRELIAKAAAGETITVTEKPKTAATAPDDLEAKLIASIAAKQAEKKSAKKPAREKVAA